MRPTNHISTPSANSLKTSTLREQLQKVLDWHPGPINSTGAGSYSTRQPAPYDRHMDEKLRLRRVVYAESIIPDITKVVDKYLRNFELPTTGLTSAHKMTMNDMAHNQEPTKLESAVVGRYTEIIAKPLIRVASTLALRLPRWEKAFFLWSPYSSTHDFAIGDGFFRVSPQSAQYHLPEHTTRVLTAMEEWFPNVGVWEFKSVFAGSEDRMADIVALAKEDIDFPWVTCSETSQDCKSHYMPDGSNTVTGARVGLDAAKPICSLPEKSQNRSGRIRRGYKPDTSTVYVMQQVSYSSTPST